MKRDENTGKFEKSKSSKLVGKRFGKLTVIEDSLKRKSRKIVWKCKCDCGNITYVTTNSLTTGNIKSCGCGQQERYNMKTHNNPTFIENTKLGLLNPNLTFSHNTSGVRGVSYTKKTGKYRAYIQFKKKTHWLGNYDKIEDAIDARKEAEDKLFGDFLKEHKQNSD